LSSLKKPDRRRLYAGAFLATTRNSVATGGLRASPSLRVTPKSGSDHHGVEVRTGTKTKGR